MTEQKKFIVTFTNPRCLCAFDRMTIQRGAQMARSEQDVRDTYADMRDVEVTEDVEYERERQEQEAAEIAEWLNDAQSAAADYADLKATEECARF